MIDNNEFEMLVEMFRNIDMQTFAQELKKASLEIEQQEKNAANPPRSSTRDSRRNMARRTIVGQLPWGGEQYTFEVHGNTGGKDGVSCGILALSNAMGLQKGCAEELVSTFFSGSSDDIREEMVTMFHGLNEEDRMNVIHQYTTPGEAETSASLCEQTIQQLRTGMLNWHTLVRYIQWKYPARVNAVVWKQQPKGDVYLYEGGTKIHPKLPILHIVHYNSLHFEALLPERAEAVACAIKGRVDNAKEYLTETFKGDSSILLVAPHPDKEGSFLLQYEHQDLVVYECKHDDTIMQLLGRMEPMKIGHSHWFDYSETIQVPNAMEKEIEEFILIQSISPFQSSHTSTPSSSVRKP